MPFFNKLLRDLDMHLRDEKLLENDVDYQQALKEVEDFLTDGLVAQLANAADS